jgi:hypothetical protein
MAVGIRKSVQAVTKTQVIRRSLEAYLTQIEPVRTPYELGEGLFDTDGRRGRDVSSTFKARLKGRLRVKYRRCRVPDRALPETRPTSFAHQSGPEPGRNLASTKARLPLMACLMKFGIAVTLARVAMITASPAPGWAQGGPGDARDPFARTFGNDELTITLRGHDHVYQGQATSEGQTFPVQAQASGNRMSGVYVMQGQALPF